MASFGLLQKQWERHSELALKMLVFVSVVAKDTWPKCLFLSRCQDLYFDAQCFARALLRNFVF